MQKNRDYIIKRRLILSAIWLGIMAVSLFYAFDYSISNLNFEPTQPVPFSHKTHIDSLGLKCTYCHYDAVSKDFANIPSTQTCITCHIAFRNEAEGIAPLNFSSDNDSVLTWKKINKLPDYVHFSHKQHIMKGVDCASCHGNVELLDSNKQMTRFTMKWCLDCHRNPDLHIIQPREVSGIFSLTDKPTFQSGKSITKPCFGKLKNMRSAGDSIVPVPQIPGRGPENCSACHH